MKVSSGLGKATPANLVIMPVLFVTILTARLYKYAMYRLPVSASTAKPQGLEVEAEVAGPPSPLLP